MNIHSQGKTLLMLAHDQLPLGEKLATQVHVTLCARCRVRLTRMEGASRLLADTIRGSDLRRWRLPSSGGAVAAARLATINLAVFAVVFVLTLAIATKVARKAIDTRAQRSAPHTDPSAKSDDGCSPSLPATNAVRHRTIGRKRRD